MLDRMSRDEIVRALKSITAVRALKREQGKRVVARDTLVLACEQLLEENDDLHARLDKVKELAGQAQYELRSVIAEWRTGCAVCGSSNPTVLLSGGRCSACVAAALREPAAHTASVSEGYQ